MDGGKISTVPPPGCSLIVIVRERPASEDDSVWHIVRCGNSDKVVGQSICAGVAFGRSNQGGAWDLVAVLVTSPQLKKLIPEPVEDPVCQGRLETMDIADHTKIYRYSR